MERRILSEEGVSKLRLEGEGTRLGKISGAALAAEGRVTAKSLKQKQVCPVPASDEADKLRGSGRRGKWRVSGEVGVRTPFLMGHPGAPWRRRQEG